MANSFKPQGYNAISPYFIVDEPEKWSKLIKDIFQAEETRRFERPDGSLTHLELKIDDSVIMLSKANPHFPANQFMLHVYVPDVRATYQKALDLGCQGLQAPKNEEGDPDLRGMFKDFAGHMWAIGTQNT